MRGLFRAVSVRRASGPALRRRDPVHVECAPAATTASNSRCSVGPTAGSVVDRQLHARVTPRTRSRTAGFCRSRLARCCRRCRASSREAGATRTTTCGTISRRRTPTNCLRTRHARGSPRWLNGWQVSQTFFWHSGLPFTVQSAPYTADGKGIINGGGPQFASLVPGVPLYTTTPIPGVTPPGTLPVAESECVCLHRGSEHRRVRRRRLAGDVSVRDARSQYAARPAVLLERPVHHQTRSQLRGGRRCGPNCRCSICSIVRTLRCPPSIAGIPGEPSTQTGFGALTSMTSPPTGLLGVGLGGDNSPRMIAVQLKVAF